MGSRRSPVLVMQQDYHIQLKSDRQRERHVFCLSRCHKKHATTAKHASWELRLLELVESCIRIMHVMHQGKIMRFYGHGNASTSQPQCSMLEDPEGRQPTEADCCAVVMSIHEHSGITIARVAHLQSPSDRHRQSRPDERAVSVPVPDMYPDRNIHI